ncbi:MAG: hypothetical protein R2867_11640 [Caldilineaceae bacterium]
MSTAIVISYGLPRQFDLPCPTFPTGKRSHRRRRVVIGAVSVGSRVGAVLNQQGCAQPLEGGRVGDGASSKVTRAASTTVPD